MSKTYELKAEARDRVGKGSARAIRRNGMIPAVIYGDNKPPLSINLPAKETTLKIHGGGFMTSIATIDVDGEKHRVLPKDYQLHPVRDTVMHVDFLRVTGSTRVSVEVPMHFINEDKCPGIKRGGTLNIVRHEVEVYCMADSIPEFLVGDLEGLNINDGIHISHVKLPEGVTPVIHDRDFAIATIASGGGKIEEEPAAGA